MEQTRNTQAVRARNVEHKQGGQPPAKAANVEQYVRVTPDTKLGLYTYAFLMPLFGMWTILSAMLSPKGMQKLLTMLKQFATLAWLKDDRVVALRVPGMSLQAILTKLRIGISMQGGMGKVSKRLSRIFRPYALFEWTKADVLVIKRVARGVVRQLSQDGGYLISRHYLRHMARERARVRRVIVRNRRSAIRAHHASIEVHESLPSDSRTQRSIAVCRVANRARETLIGNMQFMLLPANVGQNVIQIVALCAERIRSQRTEVGVRKSVRNQATGCRGLAGLIVTLEDMRER